MRIQEASFFMHMAFLISPLCTCFKKEIAGKSNTYVKKNSFPLKETAKRAKETINLYFFPSFKYTENKYNDSSKKMVGSNTMEVYILGTVPSKEIGIKNNTHKI